MSNRDNNYISVGHWMWLMLLTAIPVVGVIAIIILAFSGENESRKNYFRALIAWFLIIVGVVVIIIMIEAVQGHALHWELPWKSKT